MEGEGKLRAPRRDHLEALARSGDVDALAELDSIPTLPRLGAHLWTHFSDLNKTRSVNGMAVARLTRLEIRVWEEDTGHYLAPWERQVILDVDGLFVASCYPEPREA